MKSIGQAKSVFLIRFDYDPDLVEEVKKLTERKFSKEFNDPVWKVPLRYWAQVKKFAEEFDFILDEPSQRAFERLGGGRENYVPPEIPVEFTNGSEVTVGTRKLFLHQIKGVVHLVKSQRAILADDMGLGKTTQALVAARMFNLPIIVICPASLRENWKREAKFVDTPLVGIHTWGKFPDTLLDLPIYKRGFVVIFDEAHYAQGGRGT